MNSERVRTVYRWLGAVVVAVCAGCGSDTPDAPTRVKGRTAAEWKANLTDPDEKTRREAAMSLSLMGPNAKEAVPELLGLLSDASADVRWAATHALAKIGPPAIEGLEKALEGDSRIARAAAAEALILMPEQDTKKAKEVLAETITDASPDVRAAAVNAVAHHKSRVAWLVPRLVEALTHRDPGVRADGARALGEMGSPAVSAAPDLAKRLDDEEAVRVAAVRALKKMGTAAVDVTAAMLQHSKPAARVAAAEVLLAVSAKHTEQALDVLGRALAGEQPERLQALQALQDTGPRAAPVIGNLQALLGDDDRETRHLALACLARIGPGAASAVTKALDSDDVSLRLKAVATLGAARQAGIPGLKTALKNDQPRVRLAAAGVLCQSSDPPPAAISALKALARGNDAALRVDALVALREAPKEAEPMMAAALEDEDARVRLVAAESLLGTSADLDRAARDVLQALAEGEDRKISVRAATLLVDPSLTLTDAAPEEPAAP